MGSISQSADNAIPIIDFSRWYASEDPAQRLAVAQELMRACREVGFAYIVNHGIAQSAVDDAFDMCRRLFNLSHEEKMQAPHPGGMSVHRGYSYPGRENVGKYGGEAEGGETKECKESYEVGSEDDPGMPNIWLPEETLPGFRASATQFYWQCDGVARSLLQALALGLGLDEEYLTKFHSTHANQLRLLHYPPVAAAEMESKASGRCSAHSDWGSITLLFQDECGGLEIEDPHHRGNFIAATPVPGSCVMNVGDMLMRWSNDELKSTLHRVTLPPLADRVADGPGGQRIVRSRWSIPYFVAPDSDALIECLPGCMDVEHPAKYEPITTAEYFKFKSGSQYATQAAD